MNIPPDVVARVERDFPAESGAVLQRILMLRRGDSQVFSDRIVRCIVFCASGDISRVEPLVELARRDYRDLIVAAEYDKEWKPLRNFTQPFQP